ncbi:hypothetical protein BABINDRAFT_26464, partial [Babjeviella inositovora NRRL Y-12698]
MKVLVFTFDNTNLYNRYYNDGENNFVNDMIEYVNVKNEEEKAEDIANRNDEDYYNEIFTLMKDKIKIKSFTRNLDEFSFTNYDLILSVLSLINVQKFDVEDTIDSYI